MPYCKVFILFPRSRQRHPSNCRLAREALLRLLVYQPAQTWELCVCRVGLPLVLSPVSREHIDLLDGPPHLALSASSFSLAPAVLMGRASVLGGGLCACSRLAAAVCPLWTPLRTSLVPLPLWRRAPGRCVLSRALSQLVTPRSSAPF